ASATTAAAAPPTATRLVVAVFLVGLGPDLGTGSAGRLDLGRLGVRATTAPAAAGATLGSGLAGRLRGGVRFGPAALGPARLGPTGLAPGRRGRSLLRLRSHEQDG